MALDVTLLNTEKVKVTCTPVITRPDGTTKPAKVDGAVTFGVSAGSCTIEPIDDLSCFIVSGDDAGDSEVVISADADLGQGVVTISDSISVHVNGEQATSLGTAIGTPEPKTPTVPVP